MEVKIRESEARLSAIFFNSPLGIVLARLADGMIVDANPAFAAFHGYSRDEFIGRTSSELLLWADPAARDSMVRGLLERGSCRNLEIKTKKKSGEVRDLMISVDILELAGERYTLSLSLDVTERKKVDEELQFRNLMLSTQQETSIDGILVVAEEIRILSHNRRFAQMWGIPPASSRIRTTSQSCSTLPRRPPIRRRSSNACDISTPTGTRRARTRSC